MNPEARAQRLLANLKDQVEITEEQAAWLQPVLVEYMSRMSEMQRRARPNERAENRQRLATMMASMQEEIEAILTEEQLAKYRELRAARASRGRPGADRPEARPPEEKQPEKADPPDDGQSEKADRSEEE